MQRYNNLIAGEEACNSYMKDVKDILSRDNRPIDAIISDLKEKSTTPPQWAALKNVLYPKNHEIVEDTSGRPDKIIHTANGTRIEKAARIPVGLEELLVNRVNEFCFTLPVKREYEGADNEKLKMLVNAIEKVYEEADIDTVNIERGEAFFSCCEFFTLWYTVKKPHDRYGFHAEYKLKCKTYSPKDDDAELYPLFDEYGDLIAFSIYYKVQKTEKEKVEYFETWTFDKHFKWRNDGSGWKDELYTIDGEGNKTYGDDIVILKIPGIYAWRKDPLWKQGTPELRKDSEYMHSRDSDVLAYNSAPVLQIAGEVKGSEPKGETRRVYRVENGGSVSYVSWNQSTEANDKHIQRDIDWFWMLNQMPDISFKNLQSLGSIGYDARMMMFTDTFLRIGKEAKPLLQAFRREGNVIKAFLKFISKETRFTDDEIDAVTIKYVLQPYIPKDEKYEIEKRVAANGGQPIESQRESITRFGKSKDPDETIKEINEEGKARQDSTIGSIFNEGAV